MIWMGDVCSTFRMNQLINSSWDINLMYLVSAEFDSNLGKNEINFTVESGIKWDCIL